MLPMIRVTMYICTMERDKNTNSQTNASVNIYQTHIDVQCKMRSIATR